MSFTLVDVLNPALSSVRKKCFRRCLQMQYDRKSPYVWVLAIG